MLILNSILQAFIFSSSLYQNCFFSIECRSEITKVYSSVHPVLTLGDIAKAVDTLQKATKFKELFSSNMPEDDQKLHEQLFELAHSGYLSRATISLLQISTDIGVVGE